MLKSPSFIRAKKKVSHQKGQTQDSLAKAGSLKLYNYVEY